DAVIMVLPQDEHTVVLDVRTIDEIALVLNVAGGHGTPPLRLLRIGDSNLGGEGVYVAGNWRYGGPFRDGYRGRFFDEQAFGPPYILSVEGNQTPLGDDWQANAMHPFYTDIQRIAWMARGGGSDDYVQFMNDINSSHALRVSRSYWDVGGILRVGPPGKLGLI